MTLVVVDHVYTKTLEIKKEARLRLCIPVNLGGYIWQHRIYSAVSRYAVTIFVSDAIPNNDPVFD